MSRARLLSLGLAMAAIVVAAMAPGGEDVAAPAGAEKMNKADLTARRNELTRQYHKARAEVIAGTPELKALNDELMAIRKELSAKTTEMNTGIAGNADVAALRKQLDDLNKQVKDYKKPEDDEAEGMTKADLIAKRNDVNKQWFKARNAAILNTPELAAINEELRPLRLEQTAKQKAIDEALAENEELAALKQQLDEVRKQLNDLKKAAAAE